MKQFGLALGSSGARGSSYVGFLKALEDEGLKPSFISGSSMGSVVGGCYAIGMSPDQMITELKNLKFSQLLDISLSPHKNAALLRSNKLVKKLDEYFKGKCFKDTKIPFSAVASDLIEGKTFVFKPEDKLALGVAASSSIPGLFKPIEKDGAYLVDGGVTCRLPIGQVRGLGADVVIAVDALGGIRRANKVYNIMSVLLRSYDIMEGEVTRYRTDELAPDIIIEPELGEMSQYKFKNFDGAIEAGYKACMDNIDKIKALFE